MRRFDTTPTHHFLSTPEGDIECIPLDTAIQKLDGYDLDIEGLLNDITIDDWVVRFDPMQDEQVLVDIDENVILMKGFWEKNQISFQDTTALNLIKGLRLARHAEWIGNTLSDHHPDAILRLMRLCEADAITHMIKTIWDVRETSKGSQLWKTILCDDIGDMAQTYAQVQDVAKITKDNHAKAMQATFLQWGQQPLRVIQCDHMTLNMMDNMLNAQDGPGKTSFHPASPACLTLQAGGMESYLDKSILDDIAIGSRFAACKDTVNQTHLEQIINDIDAVTVSNIAFTDRALAARFAMV